MWQQKDKELFCKYSHELEKAAKKNNCGLFFEASCVGGVPIVRALGESFQGDRVQSICGIINGTTNYILTRMVKGGIPFDEALKEAQAKGYAEQNPAADVEGHDACRKICILADIAFGRHISPDQVPTQGITGVTLADVDYAESAGKKIKLLGRAIHGKDGRACAYVAPHLVDQSDPLAGVEDVFNAVMVRGNATGEVMFYGRGAGELPTASACVADVMECLQQSPKREEIGWSAETEGFQEPSLLKTRHYFRIEGSLTDAAMAFGQVEVLSEDGETAFLTEAISLITVRAAGLDIIGHEVTWSFPAVAETAAGFIIVQLTAMLILSTRFITL